MDDLIDIETVRAEALRKLGRNTFNFWKIEGVLKYLISVSKIDGKSKSVCDQLLNNQEKLRKQTLGRLVQELHNTILVDDIQADPKSNSPQLGMSWAFKITYNDPNFLKTQKQELSNIVTERNKLIHQDLALLDTSSIEDYRNLIGLLDEQNPRLLAHLEDLRWMLDSFGEWFKDFQAFTKSPDFYRFIHSSQANA